MQRPIYLDNHATTPLDPRVFEAMTPWFVRWFGNAASRTHVYGWEAEKAVDEARQQVATAIGAGPCEIVFTSGATEANNLAIKGFCERNSSRGRHIVTAVTEHKAVLDPCAAMERRGFDVTRLPVDRYGLVSADQVSDALREDTILVSLMHANNEIGVIHPIEAIGALCRARGIAFHTDAAQSAGKVPLDVEAAQVDLASLSAHKVYGPKGVGALYVRRRPAAVRLCAQIDGGGHEMGLRSGTLPVPLVVGFGCAMAIATEELDEEARRLRTLRDRLLDGLRARVPHVFPNGHLESRLPGNLNVSFGCVEGEALLLGLPDVALSAGSACTSQSIEPSYVLEALGVERALARGSVRFGLGRFTTGEEVEKVVALVAEAVTRLRETSPQPSVPGASSTV